MLHFVTANGLLANTCICWMIPGDVSSCRKDPAKPVSLDNVESIFRFSTSHDEEGFRMVHVVAEAAAARAMTALLRGLVLLASTGFTRVAG